MHLYHYIGKIILGVVKPGDAFAVMLLFYCLGSAIRLLLDRFDRQNEEKAKQEQEAKAEEAAATEEDAGQKGVSESNG